MMWEGEDEEEEGNTTINNVREGSRKLGVRVDEKINKMPVFELSSKRL